MSEGAATHVRGVVLAHGEMARGLVDAVRKISGVEKEVLIPLSNEGRTPERLREELDSLLGDRPAVVFTDLHGGSCATTALAASRRGSTAVMCGTNLPMLLDFVFHTELPLDELVERLEKKGRDSIRGHRSTTGALGGAG